MLVDLHMHTYFSDGTMSPEEVANEAKRTGLGVIAVTDHNNLEAYESLKRACDNHGILAIRGVEIDCRYKDRVVHILAYNFNDNEKLFNLIKKAKENLLETSTRLVERMSRDYDSISSSDYEKYEYDRRKGGWKGIHYLFDKGLTTSLLEGTKFYREYGCDYIEFDFPTVEEVCEAINESEGCAVLAHPSNYYSNLSREELLEVLEDVKSKGVRGVECYYPSNGPELTETCVEFCKKNNLIITAGSDSHGEFTKTSKGVEYYIGAVKKDSKDLNLNF